MRWLEKKVLIILVLLTMTIAVTNTAFGAPIGTGAGSLTTVGSSGGTENTTATSLSATAGNVTEVNIASNSITDYWTGFYGDVTGSITLENSGGAQFYNWSIVTPAGEVFATRGSTITWSVVNCSPASRAEAEDTILGSTGQLDGVNVTFYRNGNHSAFSIGGGESFTADECDYRTNAYDNTGSQITNFDQILLNDTDDAVYATILESGQAGFDSGTYDFELLVPTNSSSLTYYFYVEIAE